MQKRSSLALALLLPVATAGAGTERFVDDRTGVAGWRYTSGAIRVEVIQRLPDQTRAFFLARGFTREAADHLASRCLFQTIIRNTKADVAAGPKLGLDLSEWRALTPKAERPLLLKDQWQDQWQQRGESQAARIAFQWALFPTEQEFLPGDWNMGMTTYPVAPGEPVDIRVVWHEDGTRHSGIVEGPICGHDSMAREILQ